jgi:hypothetical protein
VNNDMEEAHKLLEEEESKILDFKRTNLSLLQGGKGPPGSDWLSPLPVGCVFLVRSTKPDMFVMEVFEVTYKSRSGVRLYSGTGPDREHWVDPERFCKYNELREILRQSGENE